jgi:two-component system OmpR family sensor kinase
LPLSAGGLQLLQNQQELWEEHTVSNEHMLIYYHPVVQDGQTTYIIQVARSLSERDRTLKSLTTTLFGAGLLTILIAFGVGWFLSGLTLHPIQRITQTARAIGDERDFSRRVSYSGPQDEVGQLASTINQMLTSLQKAYQQIEKALQLQRSFVADVSHELRTPLTTLRCNLGLLKRDPPAPSEEQADILDDMVDESDRLITMVNDLLFLARADAGTDFDQKQLQIKPIVEETIRQTRPIDPNRIINLDISSELEIIADRDAFKQVILIMIDNAIKHSEGIIDISAKSVNSRVNIQVKDYGEGISPEDIEHMFDRFYRPVNQAVSSGFGLGLPIAKSLVEGMGGTINFNSHLGKGSIATIQFPAAREL